MADDAGAPTLSIIIPTLNAAADLPATVAALGAAADEIIVVDGDSGDETVTLATQMGCTTMAAARGRGSQLVAGGKRANGDWLLFLHADTVLDIGWDEAVRAFMADARNQRRAAAFRFRTDLDGVAARWLNRYVAWRSRRGLPYGDQGLLIARAFYQDLGGFRPIPIMEDVDLIRRIGRARLTLIDVAATTSAKRYRRGGVFMRGARNLFCLSLYILGAPPRLIARLY